MKYSFWGSGKSQRQSAALHFHDDTSRPIHENAIKPDQEDLPVSNNEGSSTFDDCDQPAPDPDCKDDSRPPSSQLIPPELSDIPDPSYPDYVGVVPRPVPANVPKTRRAPWHAKLVESAPGFNTSVADVEAFIAKACRFRQQTLPKGDNRYPNTYMTGWDIHWWDSDKLQQFLVKSGIREEPAEYIALDILWALFDYKLKHNVGTLVPHPSSNLAAQVTSISPGHTSSSTIVS
ncbi:hypothetical protein CONLIGDRAFT_674602 [Coniochaeta ligniaria NRRL 30616]|uniref:Uncharacterized protein n=1 Tax=Coniochaeta ligniaria NRRL 30616 TaxID=1408157 RepID=A0A1J7I626_9PEZI|nr:hypothetical protein CONLIGDRAFT_674602 [Coniochaeta ligniaria NRRL 30616]